MAGLTAEFGMGSGDPRLPGRAREGRSRPVAGPGPPGATPEGRIARVEGASCLRRPALERGSGTKSSADRNRSPERLAALAAAARQPGGLPGALPKGELISETASRLDAFSGYPFRAWLAGRAVGRQPGHQRPVRPGPLAAPGCDEPTSRCQTLPSMWTLGQDQPVIPGVPFIR